MTFLTVGSLLKMSTELVLGVCIKLFCDNGRVAWADFESDFLFWATGARRLEGDGLTRQVEAMHAPVARPARAAERPDLIAAK
ncbi:MAG TPA: hypothetical protein PKA64_02490 [Myxococcota bacterium]|nr:hypothetical protein [Myxococcota bacterium]